MSPRESIQMTRSEIADFLRTRRTVALATLQPDGAPDITIVPCRYEDDTLFLTVNAGEGRSPLVLDDDRICCGVEVCPGYYEIRGVSLHGRATPANHGEVRVEVEHTTSFDFGKIRDRP
jgi:hypothetical protein